MKVKTTPELDLISNEIAELTKKGKQEALYNFFETGQKLKEAQQECYNKRIHFNKWIKTYIDLSKGHVYKLIELYNHKPEIESKIKEGAVKYITFNKIYDILPKKETTGHPVYINYNNKGLSKQEIEIKQLKEKVEELTNDNQALNSPQETKVNSPVEMKVPEKALLKSILTLINMNPDICCDSKIKEMILKSGLIE